jgi:hypothetical protein
MKIDELICMLEILKVETQIIDLVEFAYRRGEQYGRLEGAEEAIKQMSQVKPKKPHAKLLTTGEIIECATDVWKYDANDVSENTIKFGLEIQKRVLERQ